ncbi:hypothetical protein [Streptomyces varsoviensis]|uniref:hypothetical protein n=1 Tax=Streptomyces varsoviensis TaxID=67373 RepID=UPI000AEF9409|nr:hypothetical protein [Streptomyces varsoviensis]
MQPPAGTGPFPTPGTDPSHGPTHARTRPVHWIATAAALALVIAGAALVQPPDATATTTAPRPGTPAGGAPDAHAARYPLDCGHTEVDVMGKGSADFDGDGRPETVAVVRCHAQGGTPPNGVYVLTPPAAEGGRPTVAATLLDPAQRMNVTDFRVFGATISATLLGYSSNDVPRCCPDKRRGVKWQWEDGKFALTALPAPGSV